MAKFLSNTMNYNFLDFIKSRWYWIIGRIYVFYYTKINKKHIKKCTRYPSSHEFLEVKYGTNRINRTY